MCRPLACLQQQSAPVGHRRKHGTGRQRQSFGMALTRVACFGQSLSRALACGGACAARRGRAGPRRATAPVHWLNTTLFVSRPPSGAPSARAARSTSTSLATLALSAAPAAAPGPACGARARRPVGGIRHSCPLWPRARSGALAATRQRARSRRAEASVRCPGAASRAERPRMPAPADSDAGSTPPAMQPAHARSLLGVSYPPTQCPIYTVVA